MDIFAALLTVLPTLYVSVYRRSSDPAVAPRPYYTDGPFAEALVGSPLPQYMAPNTCGETLEQTTHQSSVTPDIIGRV